MSKAPTYGSLFSGIGGIDLGFDRAGFRCGWQVEIDPFCRRILERHWPDVPKHDDVRTFLDKCAFPYVDVIVGGDPTSSFYIDRCRVFANIVEHIATTLAGKLAT